MKEEKKSHSKILLNSIFMGLFLVGILWLFTSIASNYNEKLSKMASARNAPQEYVDMVENRVETLPEEEVVSIELTASNLEESINFLVCGIDYSKHELRGHLTDVIMLVSYDRLSQEVNILQIPRDCYIGDNYATSKINAVYGSKNKNSDGIAELISVVQNTFSIYIDHYIALNMDEFISIIDKIGGVEVDVPVNINLEGYTIRKGVQVLDGKYSQIFVRERMSYATGDLGRIEMQEVFLKALIDKIFTLSKSEVIALLPSILSELTTDLSINDVLGFYEEILNIDYTQGITFHDLPVVGLMHNGLSVLAIQQEETSQLFNEFFRPNQDDVDAEDLGIIDILNKNTSSTNKVNNVEELEKVEGFEADDVEETEDDEIFDFYGSIGDIIDITQDTENIDKYFFAKENLY